MRHTFHAEHWVPHPVETVFAFFANPANLPSLMPAEQRARIEEMTLVAPLANGSEQAVAGTGSRLTISFCPVPFLPFRMKWDSVIVDFEWGRTFCDEQRPRGPFRFWRHRHAVAPNMEGQIVGTTVTDDLEYEVPLGMLGNFANSLFMRQQIRRIFAHRQKRLLELLSA